MTPHDDAAVPAGGARRSAGAGPPLDLADDAQRRFGDYELLELLGEGSTGLVYRARQAILEREVALKLMASGPWASPGFIHRFEGEARNAARMDHPNIVTIHEVGCIDQVHYYSMQLIRGSSLAARLRRGERLAPPAAARLVRGVADAVAYAHDLGVLHLDLKPANVLVDEHGLPHVVDFGLARVLAGELEIDNDEVSGTPAYMAPEQVVMRACKLSAATDIWALGVILYEVLTGRPPFLGETCTDTLNLVLQGRARGPDHFAPGLSRDLKDIVRRCLYKDPLQRYSSAGALGADLDRYLAGRAVRSHKHGAARRWLGRVFG